MDRLIYFISGEYLLHHRPNGGTVVFLSAAQLTLVIYAPLAFLNYYADHEMTSSFSLKAFAKAIADTIPWLGAVFAAAYATFYSRFAAQWNYLANLYNQIMAASVSLSTYDKNNSDELRLWKAAFIEDAHDLHLIRKPMFEHLVRALLEEDDIRQTFIDSCPDGANRVAEIDRVLRKDARKDETDTVR